MNQITTVSISLHVCHLACELHSCRKCDFTTDRDTNELMGSRAMLPKQLNAAACADSQTDQSFDIQCT